MGKLQMAAVGALASAMFMSGPAELFSQQLSVGLKGGINIYDVSVNETVVDLTNFESKTNWAGGVYVSVGVSEIVGLRVEGLYSRRAFGAVDPVDQVVAELKTGYFEFPVLLTANIPLGETPLRPLLFAGPVVSFESKCDIEGSMGGISASFDCDDPEIDLDRKTTDWSVLFGAGFEYPVAGIVLGAEARYNVGLTNLNDDPVNSGDSVKSRMWEFMVGLGIPISPRP